MDIKKHKELLAKVIENLGNQAVVTSILTELAEDNKKVETDLSTITDKNKSLLEYNEDLRKENNRLFLQIGEEDKDDNKDDEDEDNTGEQEIEEVKIEDLFNDKGELI